MPEDGDLIFVEYIAETRHHEPCLDVFRKSVDDLNRVETYISHVRDYGHTVIDGATPDVSIVRDHLDDYYMVTLYGFSGIDWRPYLPQWLLDRLDRYSVRGRGYDTDNIYKPHDFLYQFYTEREWEKWGLYRSLDWDKGHDAPEWVYERYGDVIERKSHSLL